MDKKVLIIGIDSFTGKHLSHYLENNGFDVYGTSFLNASEKIYKCDINKLEDIRKVLSVVNTNYIIHLAAISFVAHGNREEFYRVNTIGTINLLNEILNLDNKPKKVILASSATVYGNLGKEVLDESLCPIPANDYAASKYAMESLVRNYFDKLPIIITRPFNYTGVGQSEHFLIPKIVKHFKEKKQSIELGNLDVSREFNDITFVCEAYLRLMQSSVKSEVVNICSSRAIKLLDVIEQMNKIANYKIEVKVNPAFIRKNEIKKLIGSNKKLVSLIGEINQIDFNETLKKMYEA